MANVYFSFPARFDLPQTQSIDGYAYWVALQLYNHESKQNVAPLVSTDAQGAWWGGRGGGTVPHAMIACFFGDTVEAMHMFARHMPLASPRIALVDFNNDSVTAALDTAAEFWRRYRAGFERGDESERQRWTLHGVRLDTSANMLDSSLTDDNDKGVSLKLTQTVRRALDNAWTRWDVPPALEDIAMNFCKGIQIIVSGGFTREKIIAFEAANAPVDAYGVGSTFLRNWSATNTDYTMDVVRVFVKNRWIEMPKLGRRPGDHADLALVDLAEF